MTPPQAVLDAILPKLRCPACHQMEQPLTVSQPGAELACPVCRTHYPIDGNILDLTHNLSQAAMLESEAHARESRRLRSEVEDVEAQMLALPDSNADRYTDHRRRWALALGVNAAQAMQLLALQGGEEILELGAGTTWATRDLALKGFACTALDLNTHLYRGLRTAEIFFAHYGIRYPLVRGVMENLPFRDRTYDRVLCIAAIHHADDLIATYGEAHRVLKPGGLLVVLDSAIGWLLRRSARKHVVEMRSYGLNDHVYSWPDHLDAARRGGFEKLTYTIPQSLFDRLGIPSLPEAVRARLRLPFALFQVVRGYGFILVGRA